MTETQNTGSDAHAAARVENVIRQRSTTYAAYGDEDAERPAAELLNIIRDALFRHVPGGGEQFLDRYLAQTRVELLAQVEAYGEALGLGALRLCMSGVGAARPHTDRVDALKAEIMARFGGAS